MCRILQAVTGGSGVCVCAWIEKYRAAAAIAATTNTRKFYAVQKHFMLSVCLHTMR